MKSDYLGIGIVRFDLAIHAPSRLAAPVRRLNRLIIGNVLSAWCFRRYRPHAFA